MNEEYINNFIAILRSKYDQTFNTLLQKETELVLKNNVIEGLQKEIDDLQKQIKKIESKKSTTE